MNTRAWRARRVPRRNMFADARSLARMYAATVSEVDGVRLLDPATVERMTVVQTDKTRMHGLPPGLDVPADRSFYMSLGFWRACPPMPWVGPGSFGHPGSGGSVAFGDPESRCRFRLRHESVVVPGRRTTGVEPGRGGRGLPRVTSRSTGARALTRAAERQIATSSRSRSSESHRRSRSPCGRPAAHAASASSAGSSSRSSVVSTKSRSRIRRNDATPAAKATIAAVSMTC